MCITSCSSLKFNSIEGKVAYEEHYITINNINYESGESENFGISLTNKVKSQSSNFDLSYNFYPDLSFEQSRLHPSSAEQRKQYQKLKVRRIGSFANFRLLANTLIGTFDISAGAGASYVEAYNNSIDTSKIEPTFKYEGTYTLFIFPNFYTAVSFTFQEAPQSTYSEFYSLVYKAGLTF